MYVQTGMHSIILILIFTHHPYQNTEYGFRIFIGVLYEISKIYINTMNNVC